MAERILCILGKLRAGGVESILYSYYRFLNKEKFQYDFVYEEGSEFDVPEELLSMGAKSYKIPGVGSPFKYMKALRKIIKEGDYKIVHSNLNTLSVFSLKAAKKCKVPYRILHNHSTSSGVEKKRDLIKKFLRPFNRMLTNKPCACSELAGRWMYGDKAFDSGKITVFRNGVNVEKFSFREEYRNEIRTEFSLNNKLVIGHIGRFMTQKNHKFLIDIFSETVKIRSDAVLMLVGGGELFEEIKNYCAEKGIADKVIFAGIRHDVFKFYSAFDVFALPSLYEGLPVVAMEACASGLSVLLSDKVTKECKISENVEFLSIDNANVWAERIAALEKHDREAFGKQMMSGPYDINNCVKELERFYEECR